MLIFPHNASSRICFFGEDGSDYLQGIDFLWAEMGRLGASTLVAPELAGWWG